MISPQTIRVNLAERSYDIEIGRGNLVDLGRFLAERAETTHVVLITDENVHRLHAVRAAEALGEREIEVDVVVVPPGEESKSPEAALSLWQGLLGLGVDRRFVVAAVGGGVVGDLAGFVRRHVRPSGCGSCKFPPRCWHRSIARSAARWASICPRQKTASVRSTSPSAC